MCKITSEMYLQPGNIILYNSEILILNRGTDLQNGCATMQKLQSSVGTIYSSCGQYREAWQRFSNRWNSLCNDIKENY